MQTIVSIPGIHCEGCAALIKDVSSDFPSVTHADVDLATKRVTIDHAEDFPFEEWKQEIESLDPKYRVQTLPL